jgi:hypothetical protein
VAVAGDNLAALEGGPDVLGDFLVGCVLADGGAHLLEPTEDFLVGEAVGFSLCSLWSPEDCPRLTREEDRRDRSERQRRRGRGQTAPNRQGDQCGPGREHKYPPHLR